MQGPPNTPCPNCRQLAPTMQRGIDAYCTACGAKRVPFASPPVNLAGQPSQVGGTIARVFGWFVLGGGLLAAVLVGALFQAIFPAGVLGWVLGSTIGLVAATLGLLLLIGGKRLRKAGVDRERDVRLSAVRAIAARNRGVVTAEEVARALAMSVKDADTMLTDLVKKGDDVKLEVDDDGRLLYMFGGATPPVQRVRVEPIAGSPRDRIAGDSQAEEEAEAAREERARR